VDIKQQIFEANIKPSTAHEVSHVGNKHFRNCSLSGVWLSTQFQQELTLS